MRKMFLFLIFLLMIGNLSAKNSTPYNSNLALMVGCGLTGGSEEAESFEDCSDTPIFFVVGAVLVATVVVALVVYYSNKSKEERWEKKHRKRKNDLAVRRKVLEREKTIREDMRKKMQEREAELEKEYEYEKKIIEKRAVNALKRKESEFNAVVRSMKRRGKMKEKWAEQRFESGKKYYRKKAKRLKKQQKRNGFWKNIIDAGAQLGGSALGIIAMSI